MSSNGRLERWSVAGGFALAAAHLLAALGEAILASDARMALPFVFVAVLIAGPLAIVSRALLTPPHGDGPPRPDDHGQNGPGGGGDDDPSPSWWPQFERAFRAHVAAEEAHSSDRAPIPA